MNQHRAFQLLILLSWILQLFLFLLPFSSWYATPTYQKILALDGFSSVISFADVMPVLDTLPVWGFLFASVGMFFFQNWGRYLFLALWTYGWVSTLLFGVRVILPAQGFFGMAIGTIDGALLAFAFLSPLRDSFKRKSSNQESVPN